MEGSLGDHTFGYLFVWVQELKLDTAAAAFSRRRSYGLKVGGQNEEFKFARRQVLTVAGGVGAGSSSSSSSAGKPCSGCMGAGGGGVGETVWGCLRRRGDRARAAPRPWWRLKQAAEANLCDGGTVVRSCCMRVQLHHHHQEQQLAVVEGQNIRICVRGPGDLGVFSG